MNWTTDVPTEIGYYWAREQYFDFPATRDKVYRIRLVRVALLTHRGKTRLFALDEHARRCELYFFSHWMGPLRKPKPPADAEGTNE